LVRRRLKAAASDQNLQEKKIRPTIPIFPSWSQQPKEKPITIERYL
jgi:hypothetical protein